MKVIKTASGKNRIKMSKSEWTSIGKKAGWIKEAQSYLPNALRGEQGPFKLKLYWSFEDLDHYYDFLKDHPEIEGELDGTIIEKESPEDFNHDENLKYLHSFIDKMSSIAGYNYPYVGFSAVIFNKDGEPVVLISPFEGHNPIFDKDLLKSLVKQFENPKTIPYSYEAQMEGGDYGGDHDYSMDRADNPPDRLPPQY